MKRKPTLIELIAVLAILAYALVPSLIVERQYQVCQNQNAELHQQLSSSNAAWLDAVMTYRAEGK